MVASAVWASGSGALRLGCRGCWGLLCSHSVGVTEVEAHSS